jgi:ribosomal RNA-processing protein 9
MSSFFTLPASQKKRKLLDSSSNPSKRRSVAAPRGRATTSAARPSKQKERDESISGSESENSGDDEDEDLGGEEDDISISSGEENETAAEKRLRLAERYLDNIREEIDPAGFDAADVDRDLIAERLKEDVAEAKGQVYRHIASQLEFPTAEHTTFKADQFCPTGIAIAPPYVFTVAKDITLCKWELPDWNAVATQTNITPRRKPKLIKRFKGHQNRSKDAKYLGHTAPIVCIAASSSGKFLATGGLDKRLVIWDALTLKPLRVFFQHRDSVMGVSFRRNTHTLYSASADRTIKIFSLDEMTYVETLFGHQDHIVDIAGMAQENCISVGSRDRTARLWRVVEESQLVFRGGGSVKATGPDAISYHEGSIDRVAMIDEDTFVTGSDNGSLSLWSVQRKKPLHSIALAHGVDPFPSPKEISAEVNPPATVEGRPQARWITALTTVPYSDLILSGSWDGYIRAWKISDDKRRLEPAGAVAEQHSHQLTNRTDTLSNGTTPHLSESSRPVRGLINDIKVFEKGDRGKDGICIVAAISKEHRLGNWKRLSNSRSEGVVYHVSKRAVESQSRTSK